MTVHSRAVEQAQDVPGPLWLFLEVLPDRGPRFAPAWPRVIEAAATSVLVSSGFCMHATWDVAGKNTFFSFAKYRECLQMVFQVIF